MGKRSPIEHREAVADVLREFRESRGELQRDVANRLDRAQSYVSKYECGEQRLDILELREVLEALGSDLTAFVRALEDRIKKIGPGRRPQRW